VIRALFLACLALAGCASSTPAIQIREVDVPTPVHCKPNLGPEPAYPDTDDALKAADLFGSVKLLLEGRLMRIQRDAEKSAALTACE
jgi:hypothetical protein